MVESFNVFNSSLVWLTIISGIFLMGPAVASIVLFLLNERRRPSAQITPLPVTPRTAASTEEEIKRAA